jgi:tripartite-type tricarboxylate transporter receptor subunit TctC
MITRRRMIALFTAAASCARATGQAHAQAAHASQTKGWPNRFVRLIVPLAPGGPTDFVGRLIAEPLSKVWGQQVVIENKPGAGGNLAAERSHAPIRTATRCCSPRPPWRSTAVSTAR